MTTYDLSGLQLPEVFSPIGAYRSTVIHDGILYTAGHVPLAADGSIIIGRVGDDLTIEQGAEASRFAALNLLASVQAALGSLDRVERFLRVGGIVNATSDFVDHPKVIDGASEIFAQVFGERGTHARLAMGAASLPAGIAVEIEATIAVK